MPAGRGNLSVATLLDERATQHPDRIMMAIGGTQVTFEQMRGKSCAAASVLGNLGVGPGDCVALFAATCPEWVYFWLGAARIGAVTAAVNVANKADFLAHALHLAQAKVVLTDADRSERIAAVADGVSTLTGVYDMAQLLDRVSIEPLKATASQAYSDEVAALFFTSGTTGPSKAVATTWHYLFSVAATVASAWELSEGEVLWSGMPLFHLSAAPLILTPMLFGGTTVLQNAFRPDEVWDDVRAWGAVGFVGAGAMVSMLLKQPPDPRDADLPLRFISAAPITAEMYPHIAQRYGCRIVTMYGLTEAFPIALKCVTDDDMPGTSGQLNPDFDVRIVDADARPLPVGDVGEIVCRPRSAHVMSDGYVEDSAAPGLRVAPHDEWFRTGDLGVLDAVGNLSYVDRIKDSLRRRGENISSVEVETAVMQHPAVAEAAAVGVPSELGEDDILVVVTLQPDAALDYRELLDFCSARMPYFCVPRYVEVLEEIPKNVIGRIRKDVLRMRGLGTGAWDRERHQYIVSR